jgi:hypothetical protein
MKLQSGNHGNRSIMPTGVWHHIPFQPHNHCTNEHDTHASGETHMLYNIIQLQNASMSYWFSFLSVCLCFISPWYWTVLVPECSSMLDFWLYSTCVLPRTADSNLNQVPCSFCTILSTFTWHAVNTISLYLHDTAIVIRMLVILWSTSDIPEPFCYYD